MKYIVKWANGERTSLTQKGTEYRLIMSDHHTTKIYASMAEAISDTTLMGCRISRPTKGDSDGT